MRRILGPACLLALLVSTVSIAEAQVSAAARGLDKRDKDLLAQYPDITTSPTRVIVRFKPDTQESERAHSRALVSGTLLHKFGLVPGLEVLDSSVGAGNAINGLRHDPHVLYAEPDTVVQQDSMPNDHQFDLLWAMNDTAGYNIHAPEAWTLFTGSPNFVIADIDSGMQVDHVDLASNVYTNSKEIAGNGIDDDGDGYVDDVHGWNFFDNNNDVSDAIYHGTHTAGTIGAIGNNALGISGINWQCKVMPLKFIGASGAGYSSDAIRAIEYAVAKGVKLSNNSWGGTTYDQSLYDAIAAAKNSGHLFVAAAGNDTANTDVSPHYPASFNLDNIISVAAVDNRGVLASFSDYGATSVDLAAPGVNIWSTIPGNMLRALDGTSMATPHVTGVAALLWAYKPAMSWLDVKNRILQKVQPSAALKGKCVSGGLLDAYAALTDAPLPPIVMITSPKASAMLSRPQVVLTAKAIDGTDGNISGAIIWKDSAQGQIGAGSLCFTSSLTTGTHTITATATNSVGTMASASITVQIYAPGPLISGFSGATSSTYPEGATINLSASASDAQYGDLTSGIQWTSDIQGALGTGGAFSKVDWTPGTHLVTANASNTPGVMARQPIQLTIIPATAVPSAPASAAASMVVAGAATHIQMTWADTSNNEVAFDIEASFKGSGKTWNVSTSTYYAPGNQPYCSIQPIGGYTWRYRVRARNSKGVSAWSNYTNSIKVN